MQTFIPLSTRSPRRVGGVPGEMEARSSRQASVVGRSGRRVRRKPRRYMESVVGLRLPCIRAMFGDVLS